MKNISVDISNNRIANAKPETRLTDTKSTGLSLEVSKRLKKTWFMRLSIHKKQTRYKIGTFPGVTIKQARAIAIEHNAVAADGGDPRLLVEHKTKKSGLTVENWSLCELTEAYIKWAAQGWSPRSGRGKEIRSRMQLHIYPTIPENTLVLNIKYKQVLDALEPLARNAPAQFDKCQKIIRAIINHMTIEAPELKGTALHIESGDIKKYFHAHLTKATTHNHPHIPIDELPNFYAHFKAVADENTGQSVEVEALLFTVLTAARTGEVIGHKMSKADQARIAEAERTGTELAEPIRYTPPLTWKEIDFEHAIWTIPGDRTKNGKDHIIPLSVAALQLLRKVKIKTGASAPDDFVFPNHRTKDRHPTNNTILNVIKTGPTYKIVKRQKNAANVIEERHPTPHGIRTSFNTFALKAGFPAELASLAIAHKPAHFYNDTSYENYFASQMVEERRELMEVWANYCVNGIAPASFKQENNNIKSIGNR